MSDAAILAYGAVSALGAGADAVTAGVVGQPARVAIARDSELASAGLARPFAARAEVPSGAQDRATWLLIAALRACLAQLDDTYPTWRSRRVGLVVGTSSGGMRCAERAFERLERGETWSDAESVTYYGPVARALRDLHRDGVLRIDPVIVVLGACASSVLSLGLGCRVLSRGDCDIVLAGGFDEVTVFVAAGFEALRATASTIPPRPFRAGRDGMALGEGAAIVALSREARPARGYLAGFGAASDAFHLTAPDRQGRGLARAVRMALEEAGGPHVDLVSPHATATPFNDPVEAAVLADAVGEPRPVVFPYKAQVGHTLGAAGALETLVCLDALERGILPAAAGEGPLDAAAHVRLLDTAQPGRPQSALKLGSAFGGSNAALVVSRLRGTATTMRSAFVSEAVMVEEEPELDALARAMGTPDAAAYLGRTDGLVRLSLAAVAKLREGGLSVAGGGIVVGSALATLETNALFWRRIREAGARAAEPRRFPYTSPNAAAGHCSIAFGLTAASFAVGGGMHAALEALGVAALLVESGDADTVVVVAVDDVGPVTASLGFAAAGLRTGAVAVRVSASAERAVARIGSVRVAYEATVARDRASPDDGQGAVHPPGHRALEPLVGVRARSAAAGHGRVVPPRLECAFHPNLRVKIGLEPV